MKTKPLTEFDVLIIGAGPSGATLACLLADCGISCCLADRCTFPREKLCGGLLSDKTKRLLYESIPSIDLADAGAHKVSDIAFYYGGKMVTKTQLETGFTVVERSRFDHLIVRAFEQKKGHLIQGTQVQSIDTDSNLAMLATGETIRYRVLVGADGVYSKIRRLVDDRPLQAAFCCESFLPKENLDLGNAISMIFGVVPCGYTWIFPRKDSYAIGLGGVSAKNYNYRNAMARLLELFDVPSTDVAFKGMHVPYGHFIEKPLHGNILLVGDAAGLADAMTGEELYYALYSANAAAEAIESYLGTREPLDSYLQSLAPVHAHLKNAARMQRIFYNAGVQRLLFKRANGRTNFVRYAVENVISKGDMTWGTAFLKYFTQKFFGKRSSDLF